MLLNTKFPGNVKITRNEIEINKNRGAKHILFKFKENTKGD